MSSETKAVDSVVLRGRMLEQTLERIKHIELYDMLRSALNSAHDESEKSFKDRDWIEFTYNSQRGYWNRKWQVAVPVLSSYYRPDSSYFGRNIISVYESLVIGLFNKSSCPGPIWNGIKASKEYSGKHPIGFGSGSYYVEDGSRAGWDDKDSIHIGVVKISEGEFSDYVSTQQFKITDKVYQTTQAILNKRPIADLPEEDLDKLGSLYGSDREALIAQADKQAVEKAHKEGVLLSPDLYEQFIQGLLECDTRRADLAMYDRKCLLDVNSGHWELWEADADAVPGQDEVLARLEEKLIARNPVSDVHPNGLIGIDFGTRSTIVSVRDGREHITLLRVGIGNLSKKQERHHYENPTIIEFLNLQKFINDYKSSSGRPATSIDDVCVSHKAANDLHACDNNAFFDSFFSDIKQWCGDEHRTVRIIDQTQGSDSLEIPDFTSLGPEDFNPLEIYAYYLGLYINNMYEGIYLNYVLSFPVTYTLEVKNRILAGFKAGLYKSLPQAVQNDASVSRNFRVKMGVSEPEAYAITALQGYGFDPEDADERIFYAIFDFGGGTTDFDFGLWRGPQEGVRDEENKDYVIEHIASEGDKYLGGENLLELLAFEIFKANNDFMRTGKVSQDAAKDAEPVSFSYTLPPGCLKPSGCETTIKDTPSAKRNTKQLMEVLRPFWEGIVGVDTESGEAQAEGQDSGSGEIGVKRYKGYLFRNDEEVKFPISDNGCLLVDLVDNNGIMRHGQTLAVESASKNIAVNLVEILEKRIGQGVQRFFDALMFCVRSEIVKHCGAEEVQIFLAGNSSKSPILKKLFLEHIQRKTAEFREGQDDINISMFNLFPPLGTEEAQALQRERGVEVNYDMTAPTGKTGVAYGLIYGREGGPIKVVSAVKAGDQVKFKYNIGRNRKGKFKMVLDRNESEYGRWVRFGPAVSDDFELYYTSLPGAGRLSVSDPAVRVRCCRLQADADADIFIRTVEEAPECIEYCVSRSAAPESDVQVERVHLEE